MKPLDAKIASDFTSIQTATDLKSLRSEMPAISTIIFNRVRGDSAAIFWSALRFQAAAILLRFEIAERLPFCD